MTYFLFSKTKLQFDPKRIVFSDDGKNVLSTGSKTSLYRVNRAKRGGVVLLPLAAISVTRAMVRFSRRTLLFYQGLRKTWKCDPYRIG
ncbi:hypothetical protein JIR23_05560 [Bradyrhizobium diazoefficiens]|nr:hypothetical protein [Bradyrhizobium diazoefficiens]QQN65265.1 hypothetical protein JIR23_05560 [Bradyrhizobium diazoefficiens]